MHDHAHVAEQLELLADQGIIERGDPASGRYRFRHALMRDAAYETQVLDVRRETHARVAEAMAAEGAEPALIAAHLDLAGMGERAAALYVAAAQGEQARGAHTEAARLVTRALELYESLPESEDRDLAELGARMLRVLSISSMRGYAAPEVEADHTRAEALTTALGSRPEVLPSVIGIYGYRLTNGDVPTARMLIERLMGMIRQPAFAWFDPEVEECAGYVELYQGNIDAARTYLERSMAGYEGRPDDAVVSPYWPIPWLHPRSAWHALTRSKVTSNRRCVGRSRRSSGQRGLGFHGARSRSASSRPTPPGSGSFSATTSGHGSWGRRSCTWGSSTATPTG